MVRLPPDGVSVARCVSGYPPCDFFFPHAFASLLLLHHAHSASIQVSHTPLTSMPLLCIFAKPIARRPMAL